MSRSAFLDAGCEVIVSPLSPMPFPVGLVLYLMALRWAIPLLAVHWQSSHAVTGAVDIAVDNFVD